MNSKWNTIGYYVFLLAASLAYFSSAIIRSTAQERILIPTAKPESVIEPMRVDVLAADGARGLRIPENIGRGWCNEAGGMATYKFFVPTDGTYTLWAYCLWGGVCTNAIYVQVDDSARVILGNDPVYKEWHWIRGTVWQLNRGTHTLVLSNHSDGIALQNLLLLSDPLDRPQQDALASCDLFYDGFDGCDGGNYAEWHTSGKEWSLIESGAKNDYSCRVLAGKAPKNKPAIAAIGQDTWRNYSVRFKMCVQSAGCVSVSFNYQDPQNRLLIEWQCTSKESQSTIRVICMVDGQAKAIAQLKAPVAIGKWQDIDITVVEQMLELHIDNSIIGHLPYNATLDGKFAFVLNDEASVWFDDLHVLLSDTTVYSENQAAASIKGIICGSNRCKK